MENREGGVLFCEPIEVKSLEFAGTWVELLKEEYKNNNATYQK